MIVQQVLRINNMSTRFLGSETVGMIPQIPRSGPVYTLPGETIQTTLEPSEGPSVGQQHQSSRVERDRPGLRQTKPVVTRSQIENIKAKINIYHPDDMLLKTGTDPRTDLSQVDLSQNLVSNSQLESLMAELWFMSKFCDTNKNPEPYIVVVTSDPDLSHILLLKQFYSEIQLYIYPLYKDQDQFIINDTEIKINIYDTPFQLNDAIEWGQIQVKEKSVYTIFHQSIDQIELIDSNEQTEAWVETINPESAMIRFTPPQDNKNNFYNYLSGYILKAPWTPPDSTYGYLVPILKNIQAEPEQIGLGREYRHQNYDVESIIEQLLYHNNVIRSGYQYKNPFTNDFTPLYENKKQSSTFDLLNDYDSMTTLYILNSYLIHRVGPEEADYETIIGLYQLIIDTLNID